jgi:hypothetical protein
MNKSKQHVEQDLARNAIYDKKHGFGKEGDYEANQLAKVSSGSATYMYGAPKMQGQPHMESNKQQKSNLMNDNPVAKHASNSWLSKHMK